MADPFDDRLRSELRESLGHTNGANTALENLTPSLRRARRRHTLQRSAASLAGVLMVAGLAATLITNRPEAGSDTVIAAAPVTDSQPSEASSTSSDQLPNTSRPATSLSSASATTASAETFTTPSTTPDGDPSTTDAPSTTSPTSTSGPSTTAGQTTVPEPTTGPSTSSTTTPTTEAASGEQTVDSSCGSIVVLIDGSAVSLVRTVANAGFDTDIKSDGPEDIEVSFEGPSGHCEIKAEIRNGQLWSEVESD